MMVENITLLDADNVSFYWDNHTTFQQVLFIVWPSVLYVIGIPGNIVTIRILNTQTFRGQFLTVVMVYLRGFNTAALLIGLSRYLVSGITGYDYTSTRRGVCITYAYCSQVMYMLVNWGLVVASLSRVLFIVIPRWSVTHLGRRAPHLIFIPLFLIIAGIMAALSILNINGNPNKEVTAIHYCEHTGIIQRCLLLYFPVGLMILIIMSLAVTFSSGDRHQVSRIQVLLLLCFSAVLMTACTLPYILVFEMGRHPTNLKDTVVYPIFLMVLHSAFAINYIGYYIVGRRFRFELFRLVRRWCGTGLSEDSEDRTPSENSPDVLGVMRGKIPSGIHGATCNFYMPGREDSAFCPSSQYN